MGGWGKVIPPVSSVSRSNGFWRMPESEADQLVRLCRGAHLGHSSSHGSQAIPSSCPGVVGARGEVPDTSRLVQFKCDIPYLQLRVGSNWV